MKKSVTYNKLFKKPVKRGGKEINFKKSRAELELEKLVLGESEDVIVNLDKFQWDEKTKANLKRKQSNIDGDSTKRKPVWEDESDLTETQVLIPKRNQKGTVHYEKKETTYEELTEELKNRFIAVSGTPSWAQLDDKNEDSEEILKSVGNYIGKPKEMTKGNIDYDFCKNLASDLSEMGSVTALEFHPKAQVILVANSKRNVVLRQVDGIKNAIIQKVMISSNFPISCARFTTEGEHFTVTSNRYQHFFTYDMMTGSMSKARCNRHIGKFNLEKFYFSPDGQFMVTSGTDGYIHMLSTKTKEFLYSSKMNSNLCGVAFSQDGTRMYTHSEEGDVYIWDARQRNCMHKFYDDGCIHGTSIALASSEQYLATGSDVGVVNIYDTSTLLSSTSPAPYKTFLNLRTAITQLKFNSTSEILAMASSEKPAALRLVHCSSMSVFKNIPRPNFKLGAVSCLDISANSGFLAVGTVKGVGNLFRLNHYGSY